MIIMINLVTKHAFFLHNATCERYIFCRDLQGQQMNSWDQWFLQQYFLISFLALGQISYIYCWLPYNCTTNWFIAFINRFGKCALCGKFIIGSDDVLETCHFIKWIVWCSTQLILKQQVAEISLKYNGSRGSHIFHFLVPSLKWSMLTRDSCPSQQT